jgi:hypothetical protein
MLLSSFIYGTARRVGATGGFSLASGSSILIQFIILVKLYPTGFAV